jgi:aspartate racemase
MVERDCGAEESVNKPILGIIGGVGPLATAYFMEVLIKKTPAKTDQDNMPMIVFNDPQIPDRTAYILDHGQANPQPEMVKVARWLQDAGADYIAIACNTAHYFYDAIASSVDIPVVNIMRETSKHLARSVGRGATIGLLATEGTVESHVFQDCLESEGLSCRVPDAEDQRRGMSLIYDGVKANAPYDPTELIRIAEKLKAEGCDAVVCGCTELSVIYQDLQDDPTTDVPSWLYDSLDILAEKCVSIYQRARAANGDIRM